LTFPDFEEFIASLNAHRVRYLIVGAYAVGFHARPRATKDIDVLLDRAAVDPRTLIVLRVPPVRIDVLTAIRGDEILEREEVCWGGAVGSFGAPLPRGRERRDPGERAAGRPQDLADLDVLERTSRRRPLAG
jgi:hypothetical protein